jgi:hypothetical protein
MRALDQRFADVYNDVERFPSLEHVAAEMNVSIKTVKNRAGEMRALAEIHPNVPMLISRQGTGRGVTPPPAPEDPDGQATPSFGKRDKIEPVIVPKPVDGPRYFILSSAQDESLVHENFLDQLEAYAAWLGNCEIMIGGFTYNKGLFEDHATASGWYHERVRGYLTGDQWQLGDGIVFCGEMNTNPTAVNPLSGFEVYTRDKWGIFPHAKIQLQAVATAKFARTKQLMTTGCVTMPNYIQKKAGIKASFHHQLAAVLVELMPDGSFFCRHLIADGLGDDEGSFYDLDRRIENGEVTTGHRVEALNYGDIHHEKLDPTVALTTWGYDVETDKTISGETLLDRLSPRHQFFHDLSDFSPRNHHNIKDPHFLFKNFKAGTDNVELALKGCSNFLRETSREWCKSRVIQSNHDNALLRWLKEVDYRADPVNALFFLECQTSYYRQLADGASDPPIFEQVLREFQDDELAGVEFISEDDSYMICGNIECAMHGHLGANGARGNPRHYTKMGNKSNTGHTHSPQIVDGAYVAGVSGSLDMGYNRGLSSWDHSHIVTYANGARAILTMMEGRWHAPL